MYPWHGSLAAWADRTGLHIDALGLVTILGSEEMDRSIGRLVPSVYFEYLPLLGAFVIAGNRFTKHQPGFTIYNASAGIMTTEIAGWFSRWLKCQPLHQVRSKVTWRVEERPPRWTAILIGFFLIGLPCNGILIAMTVLAGDWWGFANAMAMVVSVLVRCVLVAQNQAGINQRIKEAQGEAEEDKNRDQTEDPPTAPLKDPYEPAKVLVVTADSKAVHIEAPSYLIRPLFILNHAVPNERVYKFFQWIGWLAFAIHIVSIGMAALYTQIYTVVLLAVATIMTAQKIGCDDSQVRASWRSIWRHVDEDEVYDCWVTSKLKATVSACPERFSRWDEAKPTNMTPKPAEVNVKPLVGGKHSARSVKWLWRRKTAADVESNPRQNEAGKTRKEQIRERRQDLFVWLDLNDEQDKCMTAWGLIPYDETWVAEYKNKKVLHSNRVKGKGQDNK
jgi:hypothetical protein